MKNCVVQFYMEPEGFSQPDFVNIKVNEELLEYSKKSSKLYADRCGADYVLINKPKINHIADLRERKQWISEEDHHPNQQSHDLWAQELLEFHRMLYK